MKRIYLLLAIAASVVAASSCTKENPANGEKNEVKVAKYVPLQLSANLEGITRTSVDATGAVSWTEGNLLSVFDNSASATEHNNRFDFTSGTSFSGEVPEDATELYALYPYRSGATFSDGVIATTLFADQKAATGTFADNVAIMTGKVSGTSISFKNLCSHIQFTLADDLTDVKSITLMGNKSEALCGTFSISFAEDGTPSVTITKPETYVRLYNEDGSALAPGAYYFTILPVEFTEGFTVILTKTDGTQKAKSLKSAVSSLKTRNQILPMETLAAAAYDDHCNYFVKYNEGFSLTFGDYTFNKTTLPGGVLVNDTKGNCNISADGVYFVETSTSNAKFNSAQAYKSLAVIGADSSARTDFTFEKQARPYDGGKLILMANLRCVVGNKRAFEQNKNTEGHAFTTFGSIVFSNCHFKNVGGNFMQFNNAAFTKLDAVTVEDCEFGISAAIVYLFNTGGKASAATAVTFKNNIFYAEIETAATAFKLIHSDALTIDSFNGYANTFVSTIPETNLLRIGDINKTFDFAANLFVECYKAEGTLKLITSKVNTNMPSATGTTTNNYYYNSTSGAVIGAGIGNSAYPNMTINSVAALTASPLSSTWAPASEKYGAYTYPSSVSAKVGAKRADMTSGASTVAVNSAAYSYPTVDLGNF